MEKGNLSINSENILPVIKKWLYSDSDIFIRELVSNAADAVHKLKKSAELGDAEGISADEAYSIRVILDSENKTIAVSDNGIGMTAEEIKKYINEIAFSGAADFIEKHGDKLQENDIIGHFGLGFYSSFMVADKVQIDSLSYQPGAEAARWVCEGGVEFELDKSGRDTRGTTVTLYVNEESKDFLEEYKLRGILKKYCNFIPVEIYFEKVEPIGGQVETAEEADDDAKIPEPPKPINDISPLWLSQPSACSDEDYKAFYHKLFSDFNDPLFWIHLNMDYPFRLKGILYFPKLKHELESIEGQVKLYSRQVFIADNIKEVIPEFLLLLKGTLDCPDLPLNVSRSFLQNDGYVSKMSAYITKKVADKLNSLFKKDREAYNKYWDDISPFIKYGCIREKDFYDKVKESVLFKTTAGDHATLDEFTGRNSEKTGDTVFYADNEQQQAQYIKMFSDEGMEAVILSTQLDAPFISYIEAHDNKKFSRIDSDIAAALKDGEADDELQKALEPLFADALGDSDIKVSAEALKSASVSAVMLLSEQSRRMKELSRMFGGGMSPDMFKDEQTLVLNRNNGLVQALLGIKDDENRKDDVALICKHIYDLAMLSHKPLTTEAMTEFIERSNQILERVVAKNL
ncbi:MAG: molecular chaperone HtpG [Defluviitaleaceae bacterium]|nr:molecular chaperone HtpG [Defluviitaleaceae bacterium]